MMREAKLMCVREATMREAKEGCAQRCAEWGVVCRVGCVLHWR